MRRKWYLTALAAIAGGGGLHFLYDLWPSALTAVFAPVNESVWEHLKLLFWPFLAAGFALTHRQEDKPAAWSGILLSLLLMPLFLLGVYYLLLAGFGVHGLVLDIALYALTLALGFCLARRVQQSGRLAYLSGVLVIAAGLYGAALILFTLAPPELPIFTANV